MATFLFNFKKRFAPLVEQGAKLQTIRQTRKDKRRPIPGDTLKLYTGLRTAHARLLLTKPCSTCRAVRMDLVDRELVVDGQRLYGGDAFAFARADGFDSLTAMFEWFRDTYDVSTFEGFVVAWETPAC